MISGGVAGLTAAESGNEEIRMRRLAMRGRYMAIDNQHLHCQKSLCHFSNPAEFALFARKKSHFARNSDMSNT
jgi:hypothetical protein